MNDQQRAVMQMALTTLEELKTNCTIWLESDDAAITALREALAQPQVKQCRKVVDKFGGESCDCIDGRCVVPPPPPEPPPPRVMREGVEVLRIPFEDKVAQPQAVPIELTGVKETIAEGGGFWHSCSGCHELNEGHPTGTFSSVFNCNLGNGCDECGGIGAIWDNADYEEIAAGWTEDNSAQPQGDKVCIDWDAKTDTPVMGYKAQPQGEDTQCLIYVADVNMPEGFRDHKERIAELEQDQQSKAALDRARERFAGGGKVIEWVDLTDDEILECAPINGATVESVAIAVAAKLKEKNTPPVVPQGEPVAWWNGKETAWFEHELCGWQAPDGCTIPLYAAPVSTEAIRAEALEEAAKVCDDYAEKCVEAENWEAEDVSLVNAAAIRARSEK